MIVHPLCPGGTVVCIASGPSLTAEDVNFVRGKATVIAVNDAVRFAPWADVLYSSDWPWWQRHQHMADFKGLRVKVGRHSTTPKRHGPSPEDGVIVLRNSGEKGIDFSPDALRTAKNSGGAAINLAVHLGATRILLLGYDMGPSKGRHHFYDVKPSVNYSAYAAFRQLIATMVEPLAQAGIVVVNCSRRTSLTCFPRQTLAEALPDVMAVAS